MTFELGRSRTVGPMSSYRISEASERTGFSTSTLRFYEDAGLVIPDRTAAGYRNYDDRDIDVLQFVARAKQIGLSLDEINELVRLLAQDECAPVQERLRQLVDERIRTVTRESVELIRTAQQLQRVAAGLRLPAPAGACGDSCGCTSEHDPGIVGDAVVMIDASEQSPSGSHPIACTLGDGIEDRINEWSTMLTGATHREMIPGGVRVHFGNGADVAALATLAAAEHGCCRWATFTITIGDDIALDAVGPDEASYLIEATLGSPS